MLASRMIVLLAAISLLAQPLFAQKCTAPTYKAPYNLASKLEFKIGSVVVPDSVYYLTPCGTVNPGLCPDGDNSDQECLAYTDDQGKAHSENLGSPANSVWAALNGDWTNGAVSLNTDMKENTTSVICDAKYGANFTTVYHCKDGDDSTLLVHEPTISTQACQFEIQIDSSVVCEYQRSLVSSSSSSTGESSSSSEEFSSSSSSDDSSSSSSYLSSSSFLSSSSSDDDSSSSSGPVIFSSSSSSSDDWSSSTGEDSGMSLATQLGIGLGAGLGGLSLILFCALLYVCSKLRQVTSEKSALIDDDSSNTRYSSVKNAEEGRAGRKSKNERLI